MLLSEIRDWLKGVFPDAEHYYSGRLDNKQERSIGVYNRARAGQPVMAIGGAELSSYDIKQVSLLIHWTKYSDASERAAQKLWEALQELVEIQIGESVVQYLKLNVPEPQAVGTDEGGVYEYVIEFDLYVRRNKNA